MELGYLDPANRREPGALQAKLLAEHPVHLVEEHEPPFYVVAPDREVRAVLRDITTFPSAMGPGVEYTPGGVLGSTDRPAHTRQRRVLAQAFTPAGMAALEPAVRAIADELLDRFVAREQGDFVELFAGPFPAIVIAELLGVPVGDRNQFRAWSDAIVIGLGGEDLDVQRQVRRDMHAYVGAQIDWRIGTLAEAGVRPADDPGLGTVVPDDVLSRMCVAAHDDGLLSREEMIQLAVQMLVAGHETTTSLLGLTMVRLVERPELAARVRADRALIVPLLEEALRFDAPVQGLFRTAAHDTEVLGTPIPEGTKVQVLFAAANRDPERWDEPGEFRIERHEPGALPGHVAFGHGIHFCIGAPLARMEARVAFDLIFDRMSDLALDGEPEVIRPFILRGYKKLPLRWRSRA